LLSIKEHCDFWQWGNGLEQVKHDLSNIIDSQLPTAEFYDEFMISMIRKMMTILKKSLTMLDQSQKKSRKTFVNIL
jgi:hypothetical protein